MAAKQSGQTLPLVALMMVCILGIAALAVDGSNAYSQQRRMQGDLDMAVKVAADYLPDASMAQTQATTLLTDRGYSSTGITINAPPQTGPYMQKPCPSAVGSPCYAEGFLTQNVHSFFAGVLGPQTVKISVHAVAEKGGNFWQPPQLLALSPDGASNGGCGVLAWGSASGVLNANVHSNSQTCRGNASLYATGRVVSDIPTSSNNGSPITSTVNSSFGNGTGTTMTNPYNPGWQVPSSPNPPWPDINGKKCNSSSGCTIQCGSIGYPIAPGDTYYQPADNSGVALIGKTLNMGSGTTDFLPWCDPTGPKYGIYLFDANLQQSSNNSVVNVYDSTFVFDYLKGARLYVTGGSLNMWGPCIWEDNLPSAPTSCSQSPFYLPNGSSIAMWQVNAVPCGAPTSMQNSGGGAGTIIGIVDLPCTDITVTGSSANAAWIHGALVAWDITIQGSGSGVVTQDKLAAKDLPSGAVLVQ